MCNCLLEVLKCPAKCVCCCLECACKTILSVLCSAIIMIVVIGLIVYFAVFYNKDDGHKEEAKKMTERVIREAVPQNFRDFFKPIN